MVSKGASIIDIGGESTRPGAQPVSAQQELERVIPVIEAIRRELATAISIDTSKPEVMRAAVEAGANIVNDVCALSNEGALEAVAELDIPVCIMHMQGEPRTMQANPHYSNVVNEVKEFLRQRAAICQQAGIEKTKIWIDPGFGFGKTVEHNLRLINCVDEFAELGYPVLVGVSRKSSIGKILDDRPVEGRLAGSLALTLVALQKGAKIIRTHDVQETMDIVRMVQVLKDCE
jgi:dihydropteroate synthase